MTTPPVTSVQVPKVLALPTFPEERGRVSVAEAARHVPFDIKRVYWITDVPSWGRRGGHAHRRVSEALIAVAGELTVRCDHGAATTDFRLQAPDRALLVPPSVWRELSDFEPGAVCLVLASGHYAEDEYIRERRECLVRDR